MSLDAQKTVAELVNENSSRMRLFERLGIDFCCGGKKPLAVACAEKGLDVNSVVQTINAFEAMGESVAQEDNTQWVRESLTALCDHIEKTHHHYLREELPHIGLLADKVSHVHGERHPSLHELRSVYVGLRDELLSHIEKEEQLVFPAIRKLEAARSGVPTPVAQPIRELENEHNAAGQALEKMRYLSEGYTPPGDACGSYCAMLEAMQRLEEDLHQHIHKENNILFPRAIALEKQRNAEH